jgi:DHA1 family bicyclomycin/chloramphenicol resistance-like MFS transporter
MLKKRFPQLEFITLMASLMSIVALAIDAILPAMNIIGRSVGVTEIADNQLLITMIFIGLGLGPLIFGPISDSLGRKPVVYIGLVFFIGSSLLCVFANSLEMMVAGRILQGASLSAPRTISIAMIRDTYSGDYMARIMSFITVVFMLVPIVAPALGKLILDTYDWEAIFYVQIGFALLIALWFWRRQPETLAMKNRIPLHWNLFTNGTKELLKHKTTIGYTLISGFIVGSFLVYLSTAQQVFEGQYGLKEEFPYVFAAIAIAIATATFLNGSLVLKYGMEKLITISLIAYFLTSLTYVVLFYGKENPSIVVLLVFLGIQFFMISFLFGNLRSAAMQPIGHIAGIGSAITGCLSTMMSVPISTYIGRFISTTTLPLFIGFTICSALAIIVLIYLKVSGQKVTQVHLKT